MPATEKCSLADCFATVATAKRIKTRELAKADDLVAEIDRVRVEARQVLGHFWPLTHYNSGPSPVVPARPRPTSGIYWLWLVLVSEIFSGN